MIRQVVISSTAKKDLLKVPAYIKIKLDTWIDTVERSGLDDARKIPGYHDEPLKGKRWGQRSIRLNRAYRAIYVIINDSIAFIHVIEVHKHAY